MISKAEAEEKIAKKLWEIRDILQQYESNSGKLLCCSIDETGVSAFQLGEDDDSFDLMRAKCTIDVFEHEP